MGGAVNGGGGFEVPHHHMRWRQMEGGMGGVGRQMQFFWGGGDKIKSEEGEGQKIKYRSVHWNNAGRLLR